MNIKGNPYTILDADNFEKTLKNFREVQTPHMGTAGKGWAKLSTTVNDLVKLYDDGKANVEFGTQFWLLELGRYVAYHCKGQLSPGPMKNFSGALAKLGLAQTGLERKEHYQGEVSQLKDVFRLTLVGDSPEISRNITSKIQLTCSVHNGMSLAKLVIRDPKENKYGYSDINIVVILPNKRFGEIQINNRAILYGKMSEKSFCRNLNVTIDEYCMLNSNYGIPGGLGHFFMEIGERGSGSATIKERAANLSKKYYGYLRSYPTQPDKALDLTTEIRDFLEDEEVVKIKMELSLNEVLKTWKKFKRC
jgi:hypothetical protein